MRRLTAVFSKRDRHDVPPQLTPDNPLSSGSSTGSASLRTPDDDNPLSHRKSWKAWLGTIRSNTIRRPRSVLPHWSAPVLKYPLPGNRQTPAPAAGYSHESSDSEDEHDADNDADDDYVSVSPVSPAPIQTNTHVRNVSLHIQNSLVPLLPPPPLVVDASSPAIFPRSVNYVRQLPCPQSLRVTLLKSRLLLRLQQPLSHADTLAVRSLASSSHSPPPRPSPMSFIDTSSIPQNWQVSDSSPGLRLWMSRPCFEERYIVWLLEHGVIVRKQVSGTAFAVLDLEFSEAIEALAGFGLEHDLDSPASTGSSNHHNPFFPLEVPPKTAAYTAAPSPLRNEHTLAALEIPSTSMSPSSAPPSASTDSDPPVLAATTVKRGVRFQVVEDVSSTSEGVPLAYALRIKKRREEKARFLQQEKEKRTLEQQRQRFVEEEEKRRRKALQDEQEKKAREWRERKEAEVKLEREKILKEEVTHARVRRETQRAGIIPGATSDFNAVLGSGPIGGGTFYGSTSTSPAASSSSSSLREGADRNIAQVDKRYSRMSYDTRQLQPISHQQYHSSSTPSSPEKAVPRRQASEPSVMTSYANGYSLSPTGGGLSPTSAARSSASYSPHSGSSPGSSRPPSIASGVNYIHTGSSRPPSVYSANTHSSSEEASRQKRASIISTSQGGGIAGSSPAPSMSRRPGVPERLTMLPGLGMGMVPAVQQMQMGGMGVGVPVLTPMGMMLVPPVPPITQAYMMDMPLLPPTPPFMMQQYPKRRSGGGSPSSSSSRDRSAERDNTRSPKDATGGRERQDSHGSGSGRSLGSASVKNSSNSNLSLAHYSPSHLRRSSADMVIPGPESSLSQKRTSSGLSLRSGTGGVPSHSQYQSAQDHDRGRSIPRSQSSSLSKGSVRESSRGRSRLSVQTTASTLQSPWTAPPTQQQFAQMQKDQTAMGRRR